MKKLLLQIVFFALLFTTTYSGYGQNNADSLKTQEPKKDTAIAREKKLPIPEVKDLEVIQSLQLWDIVTTRGSGTTKAHGVKDNRNDLYIRRGRIGVKGKLRKNLSFYVVFAYDGVGKDSATTANGGRPNTPDNRDFYLWDAYWMWSFKPMFNVTVGYFRPQVGKEMMTAAFSVLSMEKSLPNSQPRQHFIGRSSGREMGGNIGGLYLGQGWSFNYNVGYFDLTSSSLIGKNTRWWPLLTGRVAFTLGDPEMDTYKISYAQSYFGKRKGVTFGLNGTYQGETEKYASNSFYSTDVLANFGPLDFFFEYDWLYRNSILSAADQASLGIQSNRKATTDRIYVAKIGYLIKLKKERFLQPTFSYSQEFSSDIGALHKNSFTGSVDQNIYDAGFNYYLNKDKLKFIVHYVWGHRFDRAPNDKFSYAGGGFQYQF